MKKKLIGIFVCTLLITIAVIPVVGTMNEIKTSEIVSTKYDYPVEQTIDRGWLEIAKLIASDGSAEDYFGISVSIDGDYAIIGAFFDDSYTGSAYVFKCDGTTWTEEAKLTASDGETDDRFGYSVSIDGDYAIIGADWDDSRKGSAYVFKHDGTTWTEEAKLTASDGIAESNFGNSVSIDGNNSVIGTPYDGRYSNGAAYVYTRSGTSWRQEAKILPSDGIAEANFGNSVSIDGDYTIIGADGNDDNGESSGSAYVFKRDGTTWTEEAKLTASDGSAGDYFGYSVSIDGDYTIIGADGNDDNGESSGSAYVFKRDGTTWTEEAKLTASDGSAGACFGYSVSIDGDYTIIGADWDDNKRGSAYVFKRSGTTWTEEAKLTASDGETDDRFGCFVSIDENCVIVGACGDDNGKGSAYVFKSPNQPPNKPTISGETNGRAGEEYDYTFSSIDPDGDDVYYDVQWEETAKIFTYGPYPSGEEVTEEHTWTEVGTYTIKVKARDVHDAESDWATLSVSMPRNRLINNPMFIKFMEGFMERFPLFARLLQPVFNRLMKQ